MGVLGEGGMSSLLLRRTSVSRLSGDAEAELPCTFVSTVVPLGLGHSGYGHHRGHSRYNGVASSLLYFFAT
jgi:hypothetical protein